MPPDENTEPETISLNGDDWLLKDFYGDDWFQRKSYLPDTTDVRWWRPGSVPGSVLNDVWRLGEIPNPYFEQNTLACEWVPQRAWLYRKHFTIPESLAGKRIRLHFKGVDYTGHFYLNGTFLGRHSGMYTPAVFEVSDTLIYGGENTIAVAIEAAPHEQPQVGYTSRVRTHKSRMGYWWDFCPRMVHQGIWDDVFLEISGPVRVADAFLRPEPAPDHRSAVLHIELTLNAQTAPDEAVTVSAAVTFEGQPVAELREEHAIAAGDTTLQAQLEIPDSRLWWPNGYGDQPLYQTEITVATSAGTSHRRVVTFGIRSLELAQNADASPDALPYTLVVNGRRIYIKGWNWVPVDALYGVPRPEKYARLLNLAKEAHVNLLRVWGGGLIEKDIFYDLCDRLGILVWQEFIQSSSGVDNVPSSDPEHIEMLASEAKQIIPRKRNHPSLTLWCGGNELAGSDLPLDDSHPTLAALKAVANRLDPDRPWLATSPTGRAFGNSLETIARDPSAMHDVHGPWEYQGETQQYTLYNQGASLLHSEFGVEGITNRRTLDATIHPNHQWPVSLDSNRFWWHLGAWWVRRKVWDQVFGPLPDAAAYVRATQFTQYDGLRYALEADRRRKYHNSGTLPWQFNEPYPMAACTSAVDYYSRPKPVYYAVKAAYAPLHVSATYPTLAWAEGETFTSAVWLHNSGLSTLEDARLTLRLVGINGRVYSERVETLSCGPDRAAQAVEFSEPLPAGEPVFFFDLALADSQGNRLAANRYVFTRRPAGRPPLVPLLETPPTTLQVHAREEEGATRLEITNTGEYAAMFVWVEDGLDLNIPGPVTFDANYFCLFPGETRIVRADWAATSAAKRQLTVQGWNTNRSEL